MLRATNASVLWEEAKKRWEVHIHVGAEVIKRPVAKDQAECDEEQLRRIAIETAKDEGYDLSPEQVSIRR